MNSSSSSSKSGFGAHLVVPLAVLMFAFSTEAWSSSSSSSSPLLARGACWNSRLGVSVVRSSEYDAEDGKGDLSRSESNRSTAIHSDGADADAVPRGESSSIRTSRRSARTAPSEVAAVRSKDHDSNGAAVGPRGEYNSSSSSSSSSRRRPTRSLKRRGDRTRPTREERTPLVIKRAPHQFDHTKDTARPFVDTQTEIQGQLSNEDAPSYLLDHTMTDTTKEGSSSSSSSAVIEHDHIETRSLDDVFPNLQFSERFATNAEFRNAIRNAIREDIFDSTAMYANMPEKARFVLLLPDSSLQGSWRCSGREEGNCNTDADPDADPDATAQDKGKFRMQELTKVLKRHLGPEAPTGDEFMDTMGSLCGSGPSTHWIDIVGVIGRKIPHSWHQDIGRSSGGDTKTAMLGFPAENDYDGVGVFSHVVKLKREQWAAEERSSNEPVLFSQSIDDSYIVRPRYSTGNEIIIYRDVDVLHSSPDVAYRTSVMRFM